MSVKTKFLKRILLPTAILLLVVVCIFGRLTDTAIIDLTSGFSHPLEGWDHLVTMLAVGIWAAQLRGKAIWLLPLTFVGVMSLGGISGAAKYLAVPSAEVLIILSCLVFSILIIRKLRFDTKINVLIVAFFAFFHGYAHGQEISASASLISYTLGFMVATLLLHGAGILVAKLLLISVTIFIAQVLHTAPIETAKVVAVNTSMIYAIAIEYYENRQTLVEKPPLINSPQWLNFSLPLESILQFFTLAKTYFVLCALLFVFSISQFVCYVFYPKQRCDFSSFLARCFNCRFIPTLYLQRLHVQINFSFLLQTSKRIFMSIRLPKINATRLFLALFLLSPSFAHAHSMTFMAIDWASGFNHPFQGFDHIVAMLAVGFWAAQLRGRAIWLLPLAFVSVMSLGGLIGTVNVEIPSAEWIILSSGFVLSVLAIKKGRFDAKINVLIVAFFALFHGYAHGAEVSNSANFLSCSLGFIAATSLLHIVGIGLARFVAHIAMISTRLRFN